MRMSASCSYGATAIRHDNREYTPKNADKELEKDNEYLIKSDGLREDYEQIFGQALEEYNAKQKRSDRKINDYYDKIATSKNGEKIAYEYVLQIGDRYTNPVGGEHQDTSKAIYRKYVAEFQEKNANMRLVNASIHCDEPNGTPHLHITVVPVAHGNRGLSLKNSISGAMREMGYKEPCEWALEQQKALAELMRERNIEHAVIGCHRQHIQNGLYQEMKDQALAELEFEMYDHREELSQVKQELHTRIQELDDVKEKLEQSKEIIDKADTLEPKVNALKAEMRSRKKVLKAFEKAVDSEEYKITSNGVFGGKNSVVHITIPKEKTDDFIDTLSGINSLARRYETEIRSAKNLVSELQERTSEVNNLRLDIYEKENNLRQRELELAEKEKLFSDPEQSIENLNDKIRKTELELADTKLQVRELSRELSRKDDELERAALEYDKLENLKNEEIDDMRQTYENALEDHKTTIAELCTGYEVLGEQSEDKTFKRLCDSMKNLAQKYVTKKETWASGKKNFAERFKRILPKKSKNLER